MSKLTKTERELVSAFERDELRSSAKAGELMREARAAAAQHVRKDQRVNVRLSGPDLLKLKQRAAEEGMPYQTLIASILHKFVAGRLTSVG